MGLGFLGMSVGMQVTYICQQTTHFRMQSQNSINEGNMQADGINAAGIGK